MAKWPQIAFSRPTANCKLQIANLQNAKCKLQIGKWKMENGKALLLLVFSIFRFFRTFFHKLTLIEENKTETALQVLAEIKAEIKRKD